MADMMTIDPLLRGDDSTQNQPRHQPVTSRNANNTEEASDDEGQERSGKRQKLNLYKCKQCRDARKKCFPENRVWPQQKCDRCRLHKPHELECSEPELNTRTRGKSQKQLRGAKTQSTTDSDKAEPKAEESKGKDDGGSTLDESSFFDRPGRIPVMRGIKREHPESPKPIPEPPPHKNFPPSAYLPLEEREFRILVLAPGGKEDKEVCFSFITASMSAPPEYEAVSYQWAGSNAAQTTMVDIKLLDSNGKPHMISTKKNLYDALRSLRHPITERKFWIDALCINRGKPDHVETDGQTAMKRFIFRSAKNLCFWLGENPISKAGLRFIPKILDLTGIDKLVKDETEIEGWAAFVSLLKNTVFSRLWLVQEVAVAKNVTLHCGQPAIHYGDLVDAVAMCLSRRDAISQLFRRCHKNHKELMDRRLRMAERFIDVSTNALRVTSTGHLQRLLSLEALVSLLRDFSSSDPLDRIYSVLMIAKDGPNWDEETLMEKTPPSLRIAYGKDILEVYQNFVKQAINNSKSLDIICRHWASSVSEEASLPTWVRPFQSTLQAPLDNNVAGRTAADSLVGLPDHNYYNASRGKPAEFRFEPPSPAISKSLFARGIRVDTISKLGFRASEGIILYEWLVLGGCVSASKQIGDVPEKFWRTLVADRGPNGSNALSWYSRAFLYCLQHLTPTRDINTSRLIAECEADSSLVVDFLQRVQSVIWNRTFLVSEDNGWIGLAPMEAQVGDIICVLYGCSVPVVLREVKKNGEKIWHLIGECYVHEIMDGEAVEEDITMGKEVEFELQ